MTSKSTKLIPVGATWEYVAPEWIGIKSCSVGRVWLARRMVDGSEMWRWSWSFKDESDGDGDWAPNYRVAAHECADRFGGRCRVRFRRLPDPIPAETENS